MEELTLTTPSLLFSAISLIMLAYTNRFLAYAKLIRDLKEEYLQKRDPRMVEQIHNVRRRLYLIRSMQVLGIGSLLLCVVSMFLIYLHWIILASICFGIALVMLAGSLIVSIQEILISARALEVHLDDMGVWLRKGAKEPLSEGLNEKNEGVG